MKFFANFSMLLVRVLFVSVMALACQLYLIVNHPNYLLGVQEWVKEYSGFGFAKVGIEPGYRVAYNFINGDGILVHTVFVLLSFMIIYTLFSLLAMIVKKILRR